MSAELPPSPILAGLSRMTVWKLQATKPGEVTIAHTEHGGKYRGWILTNDGRPIVDTGFDFGTANEAEQHMTKVVEAARNLEATAPAEDAPQNPAFAGREAHRPGPLRDMHPPAPESPAPVDDDMYVALADEVYLNAYAAPSVREELASKAHDAILKLLEERNAAERRAAGAEALLREFVRRWDRNGFYDISHEDLAEQARKLLKP